MVRSLLGRALGVKPGEIITVVIGGDDIRVLRGRGEANPAVRDFVLDAVVFHPEANRFQLRSSHPIWGTGAQIRIREE